MRIGNVSFGSIYKINFDYIKKPDARLFNPVQYISKDNAVNDFIDNFNKYQKENNDVSAINPKEKSYFVKIDDMNDKNFELLAKKFNVAVRKVENVDIMDANITSIGKSDNESEKISKNIGNYDTLLWLQKERESLLNALPYDGDN